MVVFVDVSARLAESWLHDVFGDDAKQALSRIAKEHHLTYHYQSDTGLATLMGTWSAISGAHSVLEKLLDKTTYNKTKFGTCKQKLRSLLKLSSQKELSNKDSLSPTHSHYDRHSDATDIGSNNYDTLDNIYQSTVATQLHNCDSQHTCTNKTKHSDMDPFTPRRSGRQRKPNKRYCSDTIVKTELSPDGTCNSESVQAQEKTMLQQASDRQNLQNHIIENGNASNTETLIKSESSNEITQSKTSKCSSSADADLNVSFLDNVLIDSHTCTTPVDLTENLLVKDTEEISDNAEDINDMNEILSDSDIEGTEDESKAGISLNHTQKNRNRNVVPNSHNLPNFSSDLSGMFTCPECEFTVSARQRLRDHYVRVHRNERPFSCDKCQSTFALQKDLYKHNVATHNTPKRIYICPVCGKSLRSREWYWLHCKAHETGQRPSQLAPLKQPSLKYECSVCEKIFATKYNLRNHLFRVHTAHQFRKRIENDRHEKVFTFLDRDGLETGDGFNTVSDFVGTNKLELDKNESILTAFSNSDRQKNDGAFVCTECDYNGARIDMVQEHLIRNHGNKAFVCVICDHQFCLAKDAKKHIMGNHVKVTPGEYDFAELKANLVPSISANESGTYSCPVCSLEVKLRRQFKDHYLRKHTEHRPFLCSQCPKTFAMHKDLNKHTSSHQDKPLIMCDVCGKSFRSKAWYNIHKKAHEAGKRVTDLISKPAIIYRCHLCVRTFSQKSVFIDHLAIEHQQTQDYYKCPVCDKQFIDKRRWKDHNMLCLGIRPFKCPTCGKAFSTNNCLKAHQVYHKEKLHACPICGKKFTTAFKVKEHLQFHKENKDFTCNICGKGCSVKSQLVAHMKTHFADMPYMCLVCKRSFKFHYPCKKHLIDTHKIDKNNEKLLRESMTSPKRRFNEKEHNHIKQKWTEQYGHLERSPRSGYVAAKYNEPSETLVPLENQAPNVSNYRNGDGLESNKQTDAQKEIVGVEDTAMFNASEVLAAMGSEARLFFMQENHNGAGLHVDNVVIDQTYADNTDESFFLAEQSETVNTDGMNNIFTVAEEQVLVVDGDILSIQQGPDQPLLTGHVVANEVDGGLVIELDVGGDQQVSVLQI